MHWQRLDADGIVFDGDDAAGTEVIGVQCANAMNDLAGFNVVGIIESQRDDGRSFEILKAR
jgi:hypothetical protein